MHRLSLSRLRGNFRTPSSSSFSNTPAAHLGEPLGFFHFKAMAIFLAKPVRVRPAPSSSIRCWIFATRLALERLPKKVSDLNAVVSKRMVSSSHHEIDANHTIGNLVVKTFE